MPTKFAKERAERNKNYRASLDQAVANAPDHVKARFKPESEIIETLPRCPYGYNGYQYDEHGRATVVKNPNSPNIIRHENRLHNIRVLSKAYPDKWMQRSGAKYIALDAVKIGITVSEDTVRQYIRDFPEGL
jgi:hypothetical protein